MKKLFNKIVNVILNRKPIVIEEWVDDDRSHKMWLCPNNRCMYTGFYTHKKPMKKCPCCGQRLLWR